MIDKLLNVGIVVRDQSKALEFYTSALGFEKRTDMTPPGLSRWVTVAPKGQDIEITLLQAGSNNNPKAPQNGWEPGKSPGWTLKSTDCRKDFEELKSRGVKFNEPQPMEYPFGVVASFSDPDGNNFTILQPANKSW